MGKRGNEGLKEGRNHWMRKRRFLFEEYAAHGKYFLFTSQKGTPPNTEWVSLSRG